MNSTSFSVEGMNQTVAVSKISDTEYTVALVLLAFLTILGTLESTAMIAILLKMERTAFHVILIGMCVSDILSACNSPLYVVVQIRSANFTLPPFLCSATITIDQYTTFGTLSHVLLLSYMRFRNIVGGPIIPNRSRGDDAKRYTILVVLSWLFSAFISIPLPLAIRSAVTPQGVVCEGRKDTHVAIKFMTACSVTVGVIVPIVMIVGFCSRLIIFLTNRTSQSSNRDSAKERNAVNQLLAIAVTVLIGYCCEYGTKFYFIYRWKAGVDRSKILMALAAHGVVRITECINPLIYYLGSKELQKTVTSWCRSMKRRNRVSPDFTAATSTKVEIITED